jgi:hypothetical protein
LFIKTKCQLKKRKKIKKKVSTALVPLAGGGGYIPQALVWNFFRQNIFHFIIFNFYKKSYTIFYKIYICNKNFIEEEMGGPGIWDWSGAPRKNNNKYLKLVFKIAAGGDFLCVVKDRFSF